MEGAEKGIFDFARPVTVPRGGLGGGGQRAEMDRLIGRGRKGGGSVSADYPSTCVINVETGVCLRMGRHGSLSSQRARSVTEGERCNFQPGCPQSLGPASAGEPTRESRWVVHESPNILTTTQTSTHPAGGGGLSTSTFIIWAHRPPSPRP